ncbi:cell wall surface anchor family protein [Shewanella denitrificans OS217]|jgi:hypothetical protein|uniref:Cell wall surface anchor family protein n=1 Tax=Shewanella denitrificans (strain OS217 / ATCC BAA-1090 / DSM 15013) TaxID=318161 RepID=Q12RS1_SHEDO|nr:hypothetical protein [Shewanella denitrificans]ABE53855.1 cell wall surface anchor family protein [Shewanella denitrificans OS217]
MKTLFTPTLIALTCFSTLAIGAEMSLNASTSTSGSPQLKTEQPLAQSSSANGSANANNQTKASGAANTEASAANAEANGEASGKTVAIADSDESLTLDGINQGEMAAGLFGQASGDEDIKEVIILPEQALSAVNSVTASSTQGVSQAALVSANAISQQVQASTTGLVQQNTREQVAQTVSQSVNAEVSNTIKNTLRLSGGL